ncbi:MAG: tRNA 2-selenouridine(34) synthase MnmH [Nanoarchaeota archaeon]|nr:tRNA 2-selenouridine(34) synthase MnmH [Nanoarchaeota archaeon]
MKIDKIYGKDYQFVDVRSPKEFEEDHIPGAVNIPLFSNEERAIVGTIYKQESKEKAIDKGFEILGTKLAHMMKDYKSFKDKKLCIYCWRGGMRSGSITNLLKSTGYDAIQLEDGYKDYRRYVREQLEIIKIPNMIVIYGLTGSGKTEILEQINNSLDLEGLAQHRGSIFGDINLTPNSQKMFESLLLKRLLELQKEKIIYVEGESRRIGRILIHEKFWNAMQKAKKVKIISTTQERVDRIYKEYCGKIDKDLFIEKTKCIEKYIGKKKTAEMVQLLEENKIKEFIEEILINYYDNLYAHTIDSKEYIGEARNKKELLSLS